MVKMSDCQRVSVGYSLGGIAGNVGIDYPSPARFTRYFAAPVLGPGSGMRSLVAASREAVMVGIVGISYRYCEHVCDVCERRCFNRGAVHRRECRG
jgi:hypothetical protein